MIRYKEINTQKERKSIYPDRRVELPRLTLAPFGSSEYQKWEDENWWMVDYGVFMDDKEKAKALSLELRQAFSEDPENPLIPSILEQLKKLRVKNHSELSALETWTRMAYQLADYCGGFDVWETIANKLNRYSGTILEAMCGHNSYFVESSRRTVVALDYCEVSLERYPYPERRRIQCDLNQITSGVVIPFFQEEQFDVVSICFGHKYPEDIDSLVAEFRRILKYGGVLSFVENPHHSYRELSKREFRKREIKMTLTEAGFNSVRVRKLHIPLWDTMRGKFYHVEAVK